MNPIMQALLARMSPMNGAPQPGGAPQAPPQMGGAQLPPAPPPPPAMQPAGQASPPGYINPVLLHQLLEHKR